MSEIPENEQPEEQPKFVTLPYQNYYSNLSATASNFMEFSIAFYEQIDEAHATIKARVVMPPAHAKLLALVLSAHLEAWEKTHGDIRIPEDVMRRAGFALKSAFGDEKREE